MKVLYSDTTILLSELQYRIKYIGVPRYRVTKSIGVVWCRLVDQCRLLLCHCRHWLWTNYSMSVKLIYHYLYCIRIIMLLYFKIDLKLKMVMVNDQTKSNISPPPLFKQQTKIGSKPKYFLIWTFMAFLTTFGYPV